ncbi:MAG: acetyltransferase [Desulfobacterales bacterium]|nr:acetyltransferase [Desulfobacterales bacterium]
MQDITYSQVRLRALKLSRKEIKVGVFGASGFAREVIDICLALGIKKIVFIDKDSENLNYYGWPLCSEDQIEPLIVEKYCFVLGIGDNHLRKKIFNIFRKLPYINLVHPTATLGYDMKERLSKKKGNIITSGVRFTNNIDIGNFGIYNLNCTIGHDCILEDFINVAPGANISGNVHIHECAYIGTNASVIQGQSQRQKLIVGENSVIGAGSVVTKNISSNVVAFGIPAKMREKK